MKKETIFLNQVKKLVHNERKFRKPKKTLQRMKMKINKGTCKNDMDK